MNRMSHGVWRMCVIPHGRYDYEKEYALLDLVFIWLKEHSLIVLLLLGTIFNVFWLYRMRRQLKMKWYAVLILSVLHTAIGVCSVKVFAFLESGDIGNMSLFGGVFLMPLFYFAGAKLFKRPPADVFDIFSVCMIFTLLCARINCVISGCCLGRFIPGAHLRWPTREAEIVFYIVLLVVLIKQIRSGRSRGLIYPLYMSTYGAFRFVDECFRTSDGGHFFHLAHIWALISLFAGLSIYYSEKEKQKRKEMKR